MFDGLKSLLVKVKNLKTDKVTFKKDAKAEMRKIEEEKLRLEAELPEFDKEACLEVEADYKERKAKFD